VKLVEAHGAQQPPELREPGLVHVEPVVAGLGGTHRAELHQLERRSVPAGPLLAEQHGRNHRQPDDRRGGGQHRPHHQHRHHDVERTRRDLRRRSASSVALLAVSLTAHRVDHPPSGARRATPSLRCLP
jgi:hypothetical protein